MTDDKVKKSSRILTFDLLRGYFLVAIIINHLNFFPSGFGWLTMQGNLYVSAAEGFFLVSGIILGIVRGAKLLDKPLRYVNKLLLQRSFQLYLTSIILAAGFTLIGWLFYMNNPGLKFGIMPPGTNLLDGLWRLLTFQYFYGWADYLRLYALFLLVSPLAMWLLRKGLWYVLMLSSLGVWFLFPDSTALLDTVQEYWQPLSWQLIFFSGLTIGFHWPQITAWWQSIKKGYRQVIVTSVVVVALITLLANIFVVYGAKNELPFQLSSDLVRQLDINTTRIHRELFDKEMLSLHRLSLFALWFSASFWLFHRFEKILMRLFGWVLLPFGQNSLYVYTLHAIIIFFVHLYFTKAGLLANLLMTLAIILLIRVAIHYKILMKIIPR